MTKKTEARHLAASRTAIRGFTLTEVAIVLGIIGVILGAIWAATAMVYENDRSRLAGVEVLTIVNNWKSVYGNKRIDIADSTDMTQMTVNNNFAQQEMIPPPGASGTPCVVGTSGNGACYIQGPWGGNLVYVKSGAATNSIQVQYNGLTATQCNNFGNAIANATGLSSVTFSGGASGGQPITVPPNGPSPITTSVVSDGCTSAGSANYVWANFSLN